MPFLLTALVGFLVLPVSVPAQMSPQMAMAATTDSVATTTASSAFVAVAPDSTAAMPITAKLTAYNAVPAQTDINPFTTASGAESNPEVIAARSGALAKDLPYGTVIAISRPYADTPSCGYSKVESQIGYRVIGDAMNARFNDTNMIDVLLNQDNTVAVNAKRTDVNPAIALGVCNTVSVRVVGHIDVKDIPDTQAALASMVNAGQTTPVLAKA